jgi:hypothetical protein
VSKGGRVSDHSGGAAMARYEKVRATLLSETKLAKDGGVEVMQEPWVRLAKTAARGIDSIFRLT